MMKPNREWIDDWRIGVKPSRENHISTDLVDFFLDFWTVEKLDRKSKTTMNRYSASLHRLGGYLVEKAISDDDSAKTAYELLSEYINPDEGPLVYHENENWQDEFDMVCRKIYKYMKRNR
jgi:hypothetical protein